MVPLLPIEPIELVSDLNARFEHEDPREVLRWTLLDSDLDRVVVASSFQAEGTCVIDMAVKIRPEVPSCSSRPGSTSPRPSRSRSS